MAYYEMFSRDAERLQDGLVRINILPLGSAALAGTPYSIDRKYTAELLGFEKVSANSVDSVSDRDFIIEFLSAAGICAMHLSRLSEELIIWSSRQQYHAAEEKSRRGRTGQGQKRPRIRQPDGHVDVNEVLAAVV
jgi:argininosuccinate lyase